MARADEIGRLAGRIEDRPDRRGPLLGRDAGLRRAMIDRHREDGAQRGRVRFDHRRQLEPLADLGQDRHAELPAAVRDHEVDDLGRDLLGGADEIAFVFAVFGIDDDDHASAANGGDGVVDGREMLVMFVRESLISRCWRGARLRIYGVIDDAMRRCANRPLALTATWDHYTVRRLSLAVRSAHARPRRICRTGPLVSCAGGADAAEHGRAGVADLDQGGDSHDDAAADGDGLSGRRVEADRHVFDGDGEAAALFHAVSDVRGRRGGRRARPIRPQRGAENPGTRGALSGGRGDAAGRVPLSIRMSVPQSAWLRQGPGGDRRRSDLSPTTGANGFSPSAGRSASSTSPT